MVLIAIRAMQASAMCMGPTPGSLPLWEEFAVRYFSRWVQMEEPSGPSAMTDRLAGISGTCPPQYPELASLFASLTALDPAALPGATMDEP